MLFTVKQAADYLRIKPEGVRYHIYESKLLKGQMIGNTIVFTKEELDQFQATRPKRGPKKKPVAAE